MFEQLKQYINIFNQCQNRLQIERSLADLNGYLRYPSCVVVLVNECSDKPCVETCLGPVSPRLNNWIKQHIGQVITSAKHSPIPLKTAHLIPSENNPNAFVIYLGSVSLEGSLLVVELVEDAGIGVVEKVSWLWMILGSYLLSALQRCRQPGRTQLTQREMECLRWAAKGKTSWEVSKILGVSERTVNFHIQKCLRKTNSVNRQQVISKCVSAGLI